jgi:hypothetical protein
MSGWEPEAGTSRYPTSREDDTVNETCRLLYYNFNESCCFGGYKYV